jgi:uncharacterized protein (TIGR03435 family)
MAKVKGQVSGIGLAVVTSILIAGAQVPRPSFEIASVKENTSVSDSGGIAPPTPGRVRITNTPLRFILLHALQLMDHQLIGAPEWTGSARFDITATFPADPPRTDDETRAMLRTLLGDRFGLVTHRETRELPMYALLLARKDGTLGPQLVRSTIDCEQWIAEQRPQMGAGGPSPVAPGGRRPVCLLLTTRRFRPVVDRTGLTGAFDMDLQWTSAPAVGNAPAPDDGPSIFTALQEQLGLKLESTRGSFDVVMVDSVRRPTPD